MAAPGQVSFLPSANSVKRDQRCCYWPSCGMMASQCNGYKRDMCSEVNSGRLVLPSLEVFAARKEEQLRAERAQRARDRRRGKRPREEAKGK